MACANEEAEAERVAGAIIDHRLRTNSHYRDYAILYRSNFQARQLEIRLQQYKVPYKMTATSFFSRSEIRDAMGYLRLLLNLTMTTLATHHQHPRRGIGIATLERLGEYARDRDKPLLSCMDELGLAQQMNEAQYQRLLNFAEMIWEKRKAWMRATGCARSWSYSSKLATRIISGRIQYQRRANAKSQLPILLDAIRKDLYVAEEEDFEELEGEDEPSEALTRPPLKPQFANWCCEIYWNAKKRKTTAIEFNWLPCTPQRTGVSLCLFDWLRGKHPATSKQHQSDNIEEKRLAYVGLPSNVRTEDHLLQQCRRMGGEKLKLHPPGFWKNCPMSMFSGKVRRPSARNKSAPRANPPWPVFASFD